MRAVVLSSLLLAISAPARGQVPKLPMLTPEEQALANEAEKRHQESVRLANRRQYPEAYTQIRSALDLLEKLYSKERYPDGVLELAICLNDAGAILQRMGQYEKALPHLERSLAINKKLFPVDQYPNGHEQLATNYTNLGSYSRDVGAFGKALAYYEQALRMRRALYPMAKFPNGHELLELSVTNYAVGLTSVGFFEKALTHHEEAYAMNQRLYPPDRYPDGHPALAASLANIAGSYFHLRYFERSIEFNDRALAMRRKLYPPSKFPNGHPDLARGLNNIAARYFEMGDFDRALTFAVQVLEMRRTLYPRSQYPKGHPDIADSLAWVSLLHGYLGNDDQCITVGEEALAMKRGLYPNGHPELLTSLVNLGATHLSMSHPQKAIPYFEEALDFSTKLRAAGRTVSPGTHFYLAQALDAAGNNARATELIDEGLRIARQMYPTERFPNGHRSIATGLNDLAMCALDQGDMEKARNYLEEAHAMQVRLHPPSIYPNGHESIVKGLLNQALMHRASGDRRQTLECVEQATAMAQKIRNDAIAVASPSQALSRLLRLPETYHFHLTVTAEVPEKNSSAYGLVWTEKMILAQHQEKIRAAARLTHGSAGSLGDRLLGIQRRIEQLVQDRQMEARDRTALLTEANAERERLEIEIAKVSPSLLEAIKRAPANPEALIEKMPEQSVLIDFVHYFRREYDLAKRGGARYRSESVYAAFVVAKGRPIVRVELGPIAPINDAIRTWRQNIEARTPTRAGDQLRELVWEKIAPSLPANAKTIFIASDYDISRAPWAALPLTDGRVLLEQFAIAEIPHAHYLLDQLQAPTKTTLPANALLVGDVAYESDSWAPLTGTKHEVSAIRSTANLPAVALAGVEAGKFAVAQRLAQARYAHLATHGFYDSQALADERKRDVEREAKRRFGDAPSTGASKNPLAYVGLVLAKGEILTGQSIVDLPLENLHLVTLSACETGLGQYTTSFGVNGLQRAFHLAGVPNVVASLWKVNDAATAALMAKFYHEMWVNKKPPIDALREAQLTIYRHPELIPDLAGERGAVRVKEAVATRSREPSGVSRRVSDTKLWAAFVLSGVGK